MYDAKKLAENVNIVEYIGKYCDLKEKNGEWWCLSPFTNEKTPSFSVSEKNNCFYDFSSGFGGGIYDFIQKYNHVTFPQAVEMLAKQINAGDEFIAVEPLHTSAILKKFKNKCIDPTKTVHEILDVNYMDKYEFDEDALGIWYDDGISYSVMEEFEVRYDKASNRIVFPICDLSGNIINVSGRTLDPDYKEKQMRKYTYFKSLGTCDVIYGLDKTLPYAIEQNELILFEGAKSVLKAETLGIHNTGAILTSHLNESQLKILLKLGIPVTFALDSDVNVLQDKMIAKLKRFLPVYWVFNVDNLLKEKDSPIDRGMDTFVELYTRKRRVA